MKKLWQCAIIIGPLASSTSAASASVNTVVILDIIDRIIKLPNVKKLCNSEEYEKLCPAIAESNIRYTGDYPTNMLVTLHKKLIDEEPGVIWHCKAPVEIKSIIKL